MLIRFFFFLLFFFFIQNFVFSKQNHERYHLGVWSSAKEQFNIKYSQKTTCIDNEYIQTYLNIPGKWYFISNNNKLKKLLDIYHAKEEIFYSINNTNKKRAFKSGDYFIPFSQEYNTNLLQEGISRLCILTSSDEYIWPLIGLRISSGVGARWGKKHTGIDLPAIVNTHLISATDGIVTYSDYFSTYGKTIFVKKGNYSYLYAHLNKIYVKKGDIIKKGQTIGRTGNSGISTGPHLHFEVRYKKIILDPEQFLPNFDEHMIMLSEHQRSLRKKVTFLKD